MCRYRVFAVHESNASYKTIKKIADDDQLDSDSDTESKKIIARLDHPLQDREQCGFQTLKNKKRRPNSFSQGKHSPRRKTPTPRRIALSKRKRAERIYNIQNIHDLQIASTVYATILSVMILLGYNKYAICRDVWVLPSVLVAYILVIVRLHLSERSLESKIDT